MPVLRAFWIQKVYLWLRASAGKLHRSHSRRKLGVACMVLLIVGLIAGGGAALGAVMTRRTWKGGFTKEKKETFQITMSGTVEDWSVGLASVSKPASLSVVWETYVTSNHSEEIGYTDEGLGRYNISIFVDTSTPGSPRFADNIQPAERLEFDVSLATWNLTFPDDNERYSQRVSLRTGLVTRHQLSPIQGYENNVVEGAKFPVVSESYVDTLYPFEKYSFIMSVMAIVWGANHRAYLSDLLIEDESRYFSQWQFGAAAGYSSDSDPPGLQEVIITVSRHNSIILAAILIVVLNWIVTIAVLYATVGYLWGHWKIIPGIDSINLPFAALFALPGVRNVMPGSPPFGCFLDFVGVIPNITILALCALVHIVSRLHRESLQKGESEGLRAPTRNL